MSFAWKLFNIVKYRTCVLFIFSYNMFTFLLFYFFFCVFEKANTRFKQTRHTLPVVVRELAVIQQFLVRFTFRQTCKYTAWWKKIHNLWSTVNMCPIKLKVVLFHALLPWEDTIHGKKSTHNAFHYFMLYCYGYLR